MEKDKKTYIIYGSCGNCGHELYAGYAIEKGKTLSQKACPNCGCKTLKAKPTL